ncbi:related to nitrate assimilation regulatory protein nirA [Phialocephala subalpina]|uniref:Related to nitrate assimilation regulatory protein nirA n=1 Tax=Phialocephala subalpina TaxID=576137 RepID=A0A1L7XYC0_9HELO|nr:related to nitrate assimilation regulatory protein nirA [Phialocephala subalpina]
MEVGAATNPRRRRGLGIVTPNACTECRKKRAKCDGRTPCGRCEANSVSCMYEIPVRQSKETMRSEIETLRAKEQQNEQILAALVSTDTSDLVLQKLRDGQTLEQIQDLLEKAASPRNATTFERPDGRQAIASAMYPARSIVGSPLSITSFGDSSFQHNVQHEGSGWQTWAGGSSFSEDPLIKEEDMMVWDSDTMNEPPAQHPAIGVWHESSPTANPDNTMRRARGHGQSTILGSTFGMQETQGRSPNYNQSWTTVTNDGAFVEHLMALYFCWEYPTFASLSKEHFLDDFRAGSARHCSSLLVNALLALGCRFSNQPNARTDPNESNTAGDHFFAEATRLLETQSDRHILTTVQALGLMSLRQASCGRSSQSLFLSGQSIRLAVEMGLHQEVQIGEGKDAEVAHAVRAWSLSIGRLPHFARSLKLVTKPALVEHVESSAWIPYTDDGAPLEKSCAQPSNVRSVFKTFCELSEIVHNSLYTLYAPGSNVTRETLMTSYYAYLRWYDDIPTTLRLGANFTPAVLFAHMYYHSAILLLFRPFIKLDIIGSGVSPRDMCLQAADAITALVNSYSNLYTLRRTPSFVPYFVCTSSIAHLIGYGNGIRGPEHLRQGVADLRDMSSCHGFANRALEIVQFLCRHWEVDTVFDDEGEETKDICRPKSTSLNLFCPNISSFNMMTGLGPPTVDQGDNPLFWPFPLQGRPLLEVGKQLEISGFKVLS